MKMESLKTIDHKYASFVKTRRLATGILVFLTIVFVATFFVESTSQWVYLIRAMAEAGMVGALADWFAVEALFRHPLNIPIPHTALLPKNKDRAARNIAQFINEYFVDPDIFLDKVRKLNLSRQVAVWLSHEKNADMIAGELSNLLQLLIKSQLKHDLGSQTIQMLRDLIKSSVDTKTLSQKTASTVKNITQGQVLSEIFKEVGNVIDNNRGQIEKLAQNHSRWWIASAVDRKIVEILVNGVQSILAELENEETELRKDFNTSIIGLIDRYQSTNRIEKFLENRKADIVSSDEFENSAKAILQSLLTRLEQELENNPQKTRRYIIQAIQEFATMVIENTKMQNDLDERLLTAVNSVLHQSRPLIMKYINQVILDWDSQKLVSRIEQEVGKDLQYIRINGAILGTLLGGIFFGISKILH